MKEVLQTCIPIVVGALIAIVPTITEKIFEQRKDKAEKQRQKKQELYVELISLFNEVMKTQCESEALEQLRDRVNLVSITGSVEVVKTLNEYVATWGAETVEEQNKKYSELLKAMRVDVGIDKRLNKEFPEIGVININVKNS